MTDHSTLDGHRRMMRMIENRVLGEVSMSSAWRATGAALALALAAMASVWWFEALAKASPRGIPAVAVVALVAASAVSACAIRLRRYRWCCAAAYCCGLAAVIGIGAFWWTRTGKTGIGLSWLVFADLITVTLTVGWLAVIVTPIERSQPDMRERSMRRGARQAK